MSCFFKIHFNLILPSMPWSHDIVYYHFHD
jgi:hypothetical protein